jgi:hypothetical protein
MTLRQSLTQLKQVVYARAVPDPVEPPPDIDGDQLAREVTRAFTDELARYERLRAAEPERLDPSEAPDGHELDSIRTKLPEEVSFGNLHRLAAADPEAAAAQWEVVKATARDDLARGWLAARALEYQGGSAWDRAGFLAERDRLRRAWQPRNGAEALLVDQMAQYEVLRLWWVGVLALRSRDPFTLAHRKARAFDDDERRQSAAEATAEAGRMVGLFQGLFEKAVRLLVSLRRGPRAAVIQNSGQVNIGVEQQVNVIPMAPRPEPAAAKPAGDRLEG